MAHEGVVYYSRPQPPIAHFDFYLRPCAAVERQSRQSYRAIERRGEAAACGDAAGRVRVDAADVLMAAQDALFEQHEPQRLKTRRPLHERHAADEVTAIVLHSHGPS